MFGLLIRVRTEADLRIALLGADGMCVTNMCSANWNFKTSLTRVVRVEATETLRYTRPYLGDWDSRTFRSSTSSQIPLSTQKFTCLMRTCLQMLHFSKKSSLFLGLVLEQKRSQEQLENSSVSCAQQRCDDALRSQSSSAHLARGPSQVDSHPDCYRVPYHDIQ